MGAWKVAALGLGIAAGAAQGELIRFTFTGVVTSIEGPAVPPEGVAVGAPYTFRYVFDTTVADSDPAPNFGVYAAILEAFAQIGTFEMSTTGGEISVLDNGFAGDTYGVFAPHPIGLLSLGLTDFQSAAFDGDALPDDIPFGAFDSKQFTLRRDVGPGFWQADCSVETYQREVVPGPGGLALLGIVVVGAGRRTRRRTAR